MSNEIGFSDQLNIETPEQVDLRFPIAGVGSRFLAIFYDTCLQIFSQVLLFLVLFLIFSSSNRLRGAQEPSDTATKWLVAGIILFYFLLYWGYFALFEAFWNGQTPGKRLVKIRVIKDAGRQITLFEALARNLLRVVDALPGMYLVGVVSMLCNREQKRLGDLVAGTIVVHDRSAGEPLLASSNRTFTASAFPQQSLDFSPALASTSARRALATLPADAVARLSPQDLEVIDAFFGRILDLDLTTRAQIAERLAARMCLRMKIPLPTGPEAPSAERLLEAIAYRMRSRAR